MMHRRNAADVRSICRRALAVLSLSLVTGAAQPVEVRSAPSEDVAVLRKEVDALRREVDELRRALAELPRRQDAVARMPASIASVAQGHALGGADAPITIVEFSDYLCPFCRRHALNTFAELKREYIDTGKVRYVLRDFPLDSAHPGARKAAEAAHCADDEGKYWDMHDALFRFVPQKAEQLKERAREVGLDQATFAECLDTGKYAALVNESVRAGRALGVTATPSFFILRTGSDGTLEARTLRGAQPIASFRRVIDTWLGTKAGG
jgi:protein-disulfide isomerase